MQVLVEIDDNVNLVADEWISLCSSGWSVLMQDGKEIAHCVVGDWALTLYLEVCLKCLPTVSINICASSQRYQMCEVCLSYYDAA